MATSQEKNTLRQKLKKYEGRIEHMYKDSKGYITIGIGHLLKDITAAQELDFIHQSDGKKATKEEIKSDYESVQKQETGLYASSYKEYTSLKISDATIDTLTNQHINSFEKELKALYGATKFQQFPSDVKLALFDMIFNLGKTKLKSKFPSFNKAIKANDWGKAAKESHRKDIDESRNTYVKNLLAKAEKSGSEKNTLSKAHVAYITINGKKQGMISSGCNTKDSMGNKYQESHTDEITVFACQHNMSKYPQQHDKNHSPIVLIKNIDKSSPLLTTAFAKQEHLDCTINFYRINEQGYNEKFYSVELKKAIISALNFSLPHTIHSHDREMHEVVELSYSEIIWKHLTSGTMGYDNWDQGGWLE